MLLSDIIPIFVIEARLGQTLARNGLTCADRFRIP